MTNFLQRTFFGSIFALALSGNCVLSMELPFLASDQTETIAKKISNNIYDVILVSKTVISNNNINEYVNRLDGKENIKLFLKNRLIGKLTHMQHLLENLNNAQINDTNKTALINNVSQELCNLLKYEIREYFNAKFALQYYGTAICDEQNISEQIKNNIRFELEKLITKTSWFNASNGLKGSAIVVGGLAARLFVSFKEPGALIGLPIAIAIWLYSNKYAKNKDKK